MVCNVHKIMNVLLEYASDIVRLVELEINAKTTTIVIPEFVAARIIVRQAMSEIHAGVKINVHQETPVKG